jgi:hypothetical protein
MMMMILFSIEKVLCNDDDDWRGSIEVVKMMMILSDIK